MYLARSVVVVVWSLGLGTAALGCSASGSAHETWLGHEDAPEIGGLEVASGTPFRLADDLGKVVVISFGYTSCLEVCPDTFLKAKALFRSLGDASGRVVFAYVTVDPDRDRPGSLHAFLAAVDPRFEGVFLEAPALDRVLSAYGVTARKRLPDPASYARRHLDPAAFYTMDHTSGFWVVDSLGKLRVRFDHEASAADIGHAVRRLLEEAPS